MVNKGDYVIRDEEHVMTVGITPDVLLMRDGEYTKLRDTDVILGKLEIGNVYYNSNLGDNITLSSDIPFKSLKSCNIVIESTYDNGKRKTNSSLKYLSEVKHKFNVGDKVKMIDDYLTTHEPEDEHEFNVGDKVKFDTFVSGTGVVTEVYSTGYRIVTSDCNGYNHVYYNKKFVTEVEPKKLKIDDKLEFGTWKLEVIGDELIITNDYPSDVIKLDVTSNGWIMNSRDETIYNW